MLTGIFNFSNKIRYPAFFRLKNNKVVMGSSITVLCLVKENYIFLFEKLIRIQYMKKNFFVLQGIPKKNETKNADLLSWPFLQKVFFLYSIFCST